MNLLEPWGSVTELKVRKEGEKKFGSEPDCLRGNYLRRTPEKFIREGRGLPHPSGRFSFTRRDML